MRSAEQAGKKRVFVNYMLNNFEILYRLDKLPIKGFHVPSILDYNFTLQISGPVLTYFCSIVVAKKVLLYSESHVYSVLI